MAEVGEQLANFSLIPFIVVQAGFPMLLAFHHLNTGKAFGGNKMEQEKYDAVVISSGIGGLCAAALLSHWGYKTLVVEKLSRVGGRSLRGRPTPRFSWD